MLLLMASSRAIIIGGGGTGAALAMEPNLNPKLKLAVQVPDGSMDALRG